MTELLLKPVLSVCYTPKQFKISKRIALHMIERYR